MRFFALFLVFAAGIFGLWGIAPILGMVYGVIVGAICLACGAAAISEKLSAPTIRE